MTTAASPTPSATTAPAAAGVPIELHRFAVDPLALADARGLGVWTGEWHEPGFAFTRLVPSWNATTPPGTWISLEVQGRRATGGETRWWSFGRWAYDDDAVRRASGDEQRDGDGYVATDTLLASVPLVAYRLRMTVGPEGRGAQPTVTLLTAAASAPAATTSASAPVGVARDLDVPAYSQEIHAGEYPEYDGGGEAWCSPTSTAMILAFWKSGPAPADLAWVDRAYADPQVDHAARYTYDATYRGAGNWPFNTAYAAHFGLEAFVTQLRSLAEAERFIAAGIPLVASVKVTPGALPGFLLPQGTEGHLLVIRGFTASGDVVANDPAAVSDATVRRVYPREAFERAWVAGSGGTVYVMRPPSVALPPRVEGTTANW